MAPKLVSFSLPHMYAPCLLFLLVLRKYICGCWLLSLFFTFFFNHTLKSWKYFNYLALSFLPKHVHVTQIGMAQSRGWCRHTGVLFLLNSQALRIPYTSSALMQSRLSGRAEMKKRGRNMTTLTPSAICAPWDQSPSLSLLVKYNNMFLLLLKPTLVGFLILTTKLS